MRGILTIANRPLVNDSGKFAALLVGIVAALACVPYRTTYLRSGETAYLIQCGGAFNSTGDCTAKAHDLCKGPFRVLASHQRDKLESSVSVGRPLVTISRSLEVICDRRPPAAPAPESLPAVATHLLCRSDRYCGSGNVCARTPGAFQGSCARAEDEEGNPTLPPRPDPAGQLGPRCSEGVDCPIGFSCVTQPDSTGGACIRP